MKNTALIIGITILLNLPSFSQDSICVVQKGQFLKYRNGYLITAKNDTIHGLIWHAGDDKIFFIRDGLKIKTPVIGNFSTVPAFSAADGRIRAFYRNGYFYEACKVPPDNNPVFITSMEKGPLNLYCLICNYADKQLADQSVNPSLLSGMANSGAKTEDEYYDIKAYYVLKNPGNELIFIPKGEKKFQNVFLPLIRDNKIFVKELYMLSVDYYHIRNLVKEYNSTYSKN
jgi:hypothetical protein